MLSLTVQVPARAIFLLGENTQRNSHEEPLSNDAQFSPSTPYPQQPLPSF